MRVLLTKEIQANSLLIKNFIIKKKKLKNVVDIVVLG